MFNYIYYRSYCFFEKNELAFDPHNFAVNIPTVIQVFILNFIYFLLVKSGKVGFLGDLVLLVYPLVLLGLYVLNDKYFNGRIKNYKVRWNHETRGIKLIKGTVLALVAISCFISIFVFANEVHKFRNR